MLKRATALCLVTLARFRRNRDGATAIEFAFVAMPFFLLIFGIIEIGLVVLFGSLLNDGANEAAHYLRDETLKCVRQGTATNNCTAASIAGIRTAICGRISMGGMSCGSQSLKLAVYAADDLVASPIPASTLIDEKGIDLANSRSYVIAVGYEWPFALLTTKMLLATAGDRSQLQARVYYSTAERALR